MPGCRAALGAPEVTVHPRSSASRATHEHRDLDADHPPVRRLGGQPRVRLDFEGSTTPSRRRQRARRPSSSRSRRPTPARRLALGADRAGPGWTARTWPAKFAPAPGHRAAKLRLALDHNEPALTDS